MVYKFEPNIFQVEVKVEDLQSCTSDFSHGWFATSNSFFKEPPHKTRWWFQTFFMFTPKIGEDFQFDSYFSDGLVQPPTRKPLIVAEDVEEALK